MESERAIQLSKSFSQRELTMLTDFYEITMANGYFLEGFKDTVCYFDMFFRKLPDNGGFAIMAGVEQLVEYLKGLHFSPEDIAYLSGRNMFSEISSFPAMCGPFRRGRRFFPVSLLLPFGAR